MFDTAALVCWCEKVAILKFVHTVGHMQGKFALYLTLSACWTSQAVPAHVSSCPTLKTLGPHCLILAFLVVLCTCPHGFAVRACIRAGIARGRASTRAVNHLLHAPYMAMYIQRKHICRGTRCRCMFYCTRLECAVCNNVGGFQDDFCKCF